MSCLSVNYRWIGNDPTVRELRGFVKQMDPALLFVMETKIEGKRVENLKSTLGFAGGFAVDSVGLSGGIGIFWSSAVTVEVKSFNKYHIDAIVQLKDNSIPKWRFTGIYGDPRRENRHHTWTLMRRLKGLQNLPWLCVDDFNEIMYNTEHFSEHNRDEWQMIEFRDTLEDCDLPDLGFSGQPFTWDNRQDGRANVKARLDRACGTEEFCQLFQVLRVRHINMVQTYHCMLAIEMKKYMQQRFTRGRNFKYENV
jgi:hypothetical protein